MSPAVAWLWWSSGKDSAWALHELDRLGEVRVAGLVTTLHAAASRVAMHEVRLELLRAQARATGRDLHEVPLPWPCPNEIYEAGVVEVLDLARTRGVTHMAFGDLALREVRDYRVCLLEGSGIEPVFPLWGRNTHALAREMIGAGVRARLSCVDSSRLPSSFAGRPFDERLLAELPADVDPCGENGEFHTFACDGPMFRAPIAVRVGEREEREGFAFADLELASAAPPELELRPRRPADTEWVRDCVTEAWGEPFVVSRGRGHHPLELPGLVAELDGERVGLLTYDVRDAQLEVVTVQALRRRAGVGRALLEEARERAREERCKRLWLVTTNDNETAIAFYRGLGMELVAVHEGALAASRELKPGIPRANAAGHPIEDEWEFAWRLS